MAPFRGTLCILVLVASTVSVYSGAVRYDGYSLLRTVPKEEEQVKRLAILRNDPHVDFWAEPRVAGHPVDIFVSPERVNSVRDLLQDLKLDSEVLIEDAQPLIEESQFDEPRGFAGPKTLDWNNYHTIDTIHAWLEDQAKAYPNIATLINAGKTTEGRRLLGLRVAHKPGLPIVFIEAGIHAREWISPAVATWFIQNALNTTSEVVKSYEWHVFPSVNPDGYAYTKENRMWRKTRSKAGWFCYGVDANRNWPYKWESAFWACTETYPGAKPASEPETQGLMSYLNSVASRTRVYISLHSYSQLLMYPWGYTSDLPNNAKRFDEIARKAVGNLTARYGTEYRYGPIATTIYPANGNTIDYAYSLNITYPFVFELRDTGRFGFLLPKQEIIPTALETFDALNVILEEAQK